MTDNNVIDFPEIVFTCSCSCKSFFLHQTGTIECANCNNKTYDMPEKGKWVEQTKNIPSEPNGTDAGLISHKVLGNREFVKKSIIKQAKEWDDKNTLTIISIFDNEGAGKHWVDIETQEQKDWCIRKITEMLEYLKKTAV